MHIFVEGVAHYGPLKHLSVTMPLIWTMLPIGTGNEHVDRGLTIKNLYIQCTRLLLYI